MDKVGDDQEVAGKSHSDYRAELEFETVAVRLDRFLRLQAERDKPGFESAEGGAAQCCLFVDAFIGGEGRQDRLARLRDEGATPRDDERVVAGLGQVGENLPHLCRRAEVMRARQPLAVGIRHDRALRNTHQRVMRLVKVAVGEIDVVGRDQWQAMTVGQLDQARLAPGLVGRAVARQFDIETVRECRRELAQHPHRGFRLPLGEEPPDRAPRTARQTEQSITSPGQVGEADRRLARRFTGEIGLAHQPQEIAIARLVLNQQYDPVRLG